MLTTGPIAPCNFTNLCLRNSHGVEPGSPNRRCPTATSRHKHKCHFLAMGF
uniref:Uncharacterized protein LOC101306919 n=1 Tax=Rhizophora mucronata TaxID=61149 RepID=A0A2P2JZ07_RHIMU